MQPALPRPEEAAARARHGAAPAPGFGAIARPAEPPVPAFSWRYSPFLAMAQKLKTRRRDGTTELILSPMALLEKVAKLIRHARMHLRIDGTKRPVLSPWWLRDLH